MGWTGYRRRDEDRAAAFAAALHEHLADVKVLAGPVWTPPEGVTHEARAWVMAEMPDGSGPLIVLCLLAQGDDVHPRYIYVKDVDESMGPLCYDVPLTWLAIAPVRPPFGNDWRKKVLGYWEAAGGWGKAAH